LASTRFTRRQFIVGAGQGALAASIAGCAAAKPRVGASDGESLAPQRGHQRLDPRQLRKWEALGYGMFIHFGMSTFVEKDAPDDRVSAGLYAPDRLDIDQWACVARDAGMKYAVLTVKHTSGHCLWPSKQTDYTVAHSGHRADVMELFVDACRKRGVLPGFYYCSWDNGHRFGSRTHSDKPFGVYVNPPDFTRLRDGMVVHPDKPEYLAAYTSSLYQDFVTAQMTELLTNYGPMVEVWIDIPGVLGRGYRAFLYRHITSLQPDTVVVANHGTNNGESFREAYVWPCDAISLEQTLPPEAGFSKWRTIQGREYCMAGECCATLGESWFHTPKDAPRPDKALAELCAGCKARGVNLLLNVPPDKHGLIQDSYIQALQRLRKTAMQ